MAETSKVDPSHLNPRARADRALEVALQGFDGLASYEILRQMHQALALIAAGRLDFGSNDRLWDFFRTVVGVVIQRDREEHGFQTGMRVLAIKPFHEPTSLPRLFQLPPDDFRGIPILDTGRIAAIVLAHYAPELVRVVPPKLRPKTATYEVAFPEEALRKIVHEEIINARGPAVEFRPGEGFRLTKEAGFDVAPEETAPPPPEKPPAEKPPTPSEETVAVRTPPSTPVPQHPVWPDPAQIRTYGSPELTATLKAWRQVFEASGARPPENVYQTLRRRFEEVFKFPAPEIFPIAPAPPTSPPPPTAFVGEIHAAPSAPEVPTGELFGGRPPQPLTEKYRPRTLEEVIGHRRAIRQLVQMVRSGNYPACFFFWGPPGTGKSSTAAALVRSYFMQEGKRRNDAVLQDPTTSLRDLGVAIFGSEDLKGEPSAFVQSRLIPAIRTQPMGGPAGLKRWVILNDVLELLSPAAQGQLLNPLEHTRATIIFTTNDVSKVIPALRSRCAEGSFEFFPLSVDDVTARLTTVAEHEGYAFPDLAKVAHDVAVAAQGDVRVAIALLQQRYREELAGRES